MGMAKKKAAAPREEAPVAPAADLNHIHPALRGLAISLDLLTPDQDNANIHDQASIEAIKSSFTRFGQDVPLVVQRQGMIVRKGNGRLTAARGLGWSHIAALIVEESDVEAAARAIADNQTGRLSRWDPTRLGKAIEALAKHEDKTLAASTGFTAEDIARLAGFSEAFVQPKPPSGEEGTGTGEGEPAPPPPPAAEYVSLVVSLTPGDRDKVVGYLEGVKTQRGLDSLGDALVSILFSRES